MKEKLNIVDRHEILIFDMDGTLYEHDGEGGTFKNSSLIKNVISNSVDFVISKENCPRDIAEKLIQESLKDPIGTSHVLSKRYGISRADFFDVVWNIDPKKVVKNFEKPTEAVRMLKMNGKRMFLLTAAPRVWMVNVVRELSLAGIFERKYHGEMFDKKDKIFEDLAKEFDPKKLLSIGDQFETDLMPAQNLGMSIFQVKNQDDFEKLI